MKSPKKTKVLVVDDSALIRVLLRTILEKASHIEVVDTATDAYDARRKIKKYNPDVITLDIEMPGMDGITFLSNLMRLRPMPVIMVSSLTEAGAEVTLNALSIGAFDFVTKPKAEVKERLELLSEELIEKVTAAAKCNLGALESSSDAYHDQPTAYKHTDSQTRPAHFSTELIAVGASTGGTEAIHGIISQLPGNLPPIVMTQHIPDVFSTSFANRLDRESELTVVEVRKETIMRPGHAYLAPGHRHIVVVQKGGKLHAIPQDGEPVNRHKPSVDILFNSIAKLEIAGRTMAFLLTGMGVDGAQGLLHLKEAGAKTFAQDEKSSVVWGMPGAAVKIGAAQHQIPLAEIPRILAATISGVDSFAVS